MPLVLDGTNGVSGVDGTASNPAIEGTDSNTGIFYPAADTVAIGTNGTEALRVNSSQNVGVGTNSPLGRLHTSETNGINYFESPGVSSIALQFRTNSVNRYRVGIPSASNDLAFYAGGTTETMRLDSSGNVGIGTSSPGAKLDVVGDLKLNGFSVYSGSASLGANMFAGTAFNTGGAAVAFRGTSSGFNNGGIEFYTGSGSTGTERARITSGGVFMVGTTGLGGNGTACSFAGSAAVVRIFGTTQADSALVVDKSTNVNTTAQVFVRFTIDNQNTGNGQINGNGANAAAFGTFSDRRLKENIVDLPPQLDNILALRPVEYDYIESEGGGHQLGFIAQEVQEVYPDLVGEREDGMLTLSDMNKNDARLIKAFQELAAKVTALEAEIDVLKGNA